MHPLHNLAVVSVRPEADRHARRCAAAQLDADAAARRRERRPSSAWTATASCKSRATQIAAVDPLQLPLSRTMQFRDSNLEVATLVNPPDDFDGVLADNDGAVRGAVVELRRWTTAARLVQENRGVAIDLVAEMLQHRAQRRSRCTRWMWSSSRSRWPRRAAWACPMRGCAACRRRNPAGAPGAERGAHDRRVGRRPRLLQPGRPAAGHRWRSRHRLPRCGARGGGRARRCAVTVWRGDGEHDARQCRPRR